MGKRWRYPQVVPSRPPAISVRVYCLRCRWNVPERPDGIARVRTHVVAAHGEPPVRGQSWAFGGCYEPRPAAGSLWR